MFQRRRLVEFSREEGAVSRHTWDQISCRAHGHTNPNDLSLLSGCLIHRRRKPSFKSCFCEPPDLQSPCSQYLGTLRECFQLVSEWARERVVVGLQTISVVVFCDTAERFSLTSSLHFLLSSETAHPIDAGSTVTRSVSVLNILLLQGNQNFSLPKFLP